MVGTLLRQGLVNPIPFISTLQTVVACETDQRTNDKAFRCLALIAEKNPQHIRSRFVDSVMATQAYQATYFDRALKKKKQLMRATLGVYQLGTSVSGIGLGATKILNGAYGDANDEEEDEDEDEDEDEKSAKKKTKQKKKKTNKGAFLNRCLVVCTKHLFSAPKAK
jgi:hypothetical protein